jgi:hypothetical protein
MVTSARSDRPIATPWLVSRSQRCSDPAVLRWHKMDRPASTVEYADGRVYAGPGSAAGAEISRGRGVIATVPRHVWAGRFYIGTTGTAAAQLILGLVGLCFTLFCFIGMLILVPLWIWTFIDAIMMFTGFVTDSYGRKLQ